MNKLIFALAVSCVTCLASGTYEDFERAIAKVESSGNTKAVGDNGKAIGIFQIHESCWRDSGVKGSYNQCFDAKYSKQVMRAYLLRYAKKAVKSNDFETLAKVWNGGPNGAKNKKTNNYWFKVKKNL